ncbi:MAG TPA: hypothetical protein VE713_16875 [Pyrinomonadaceae bacterium]|jgi:hypothetical protein|nr:hypothetical protein [Pyrinomonadaceae bacterium]
MIRVHIEQLILDGIDVTPSDTPKLQAAVERELARLVGERGLAPEMRGGAALESARGGPVRLESTKTPAGLGRQLARAIHKGIG